ncbi:MAG: fused response regulator/phosphatase [Candidatus Eremiobacteraeota bacterium]|nr:fused response regulator/phosphatase [Candidatus Eremiobacteraeota bacterium]
MDSKPRLLIVDDSPGNIHVLAHYLTPLCSVQTAGSGAQALEMVRLGPLPDLILLDVSMPDISGYEVCRQLKEESSTRSIPVIFVTGMTAVEDEKRGLDLGAVDYISKPFHEDLVRARVSNHLELKRHRDNLEELVRLRSSQLVEEQKARHKLESELDVASRLQRSMLPAPLRFPSANLELAGYLSAARAVGGDLYDYFFLDPETLFFIVGDVSDKGVAAALFMVQVRVLLRGLASKTTSPAELLRQLNDELCLDNQECMFVTLLCGRLCINSQTLLLARGGHEHPILTVPGSSPTYLETPGGAALGLTEHQQYQDFHCPFLPGQSLILYTDGVIEASDVHGQLYGEERFLESAARSQSFSARRTLESLRQDLAAFVGSAEPSDDVTILILKAPL